jgi:predicted membrane-bound mannosyltransferase
LPELPNESHFCASLGNKGMNDLLPKIIARAMRLRHTLPPSCKTAQIMSAFYTPRRAAYAALKAQSLLRMVVVLINQASRHYIDR